MNEQLTVCKLPRQHNPPPSFNGMTVPFLGDRGSGGGFGKSDRGSGGSGGSSYSGQGDMEIQQDTIFVSGMGEDCTEEAMVQHFGSIGVIKVGFLCVCHHDPPV